MTQEVTDFRKSCPCQQTQAGVSSLCSNETVSVLIVLYQGSSDVHQHLLIRTILDCSGPPSYGRRTDNRQSQTILESKL